MAPTKIAFHNFDPEIVANFLVKKDYERCWHYIVELIESFSVQKNRKLNLAIQKGTKNDTFRQHLENFSKLMGELLFALLTDPSIKIPDSSFIGLIGCHEQIHNFFSVYGVEETDSVVEKIIQGKKKLSPMEQKRMLLLLSADTNLDIIKIVKKTNAQYRSLAVNSCLLYLQVYKKNVYQNKIKLMDEMGGLLRTILSKATSEEHLDRLLGNLLSCYFSCSYLDYDKKHDVKKHINSAITGYFKKHVLRIANKVRSEQSNVSSNKTEKPKLLVVLENYGHNHAMERCYDSWLVSYQETFDVSLCLSQNKVYPELLKKHKIIPYSNSAHFIEIISGHQADMILFPSVGMAFEGVLASNFRFASVQAMFIGHPATTKSPHIDFVYGPEEFYDQRAFPTDRYVAGHARYQFENNLTKDEIQKVPISSYDPANPRPLRVSIVGSFTKIGYPFLKMLQEIEQQSPFEIEFIFHLSSTGMDAYTFREYLKTQFRNLTLYGFQEYEQFLESIGKTDIVLNPFPFGHTNTIIDTLLLGKPCISYFGIEPSARTEHYVLSRVNMVEKFEVTTQEEYKEKFQELAAEIMQGHTDFYDRNTAYDALIANQEDLIKQHDPAKELKWLYEHAQEMKESKDKCFHIPEKLD